MSNNKFKNPEDFRAGAQAEQLQNTLIPMRKPCQTFESTTIEIACGMVDYISNNLGIKEIDDIQFEVVLNKQGYLDDILVYAVFNPSDTNGNIYRVGRRGKNGKLIAGDDGTFNLAGCIKGATTSGGYAASDLFKKNFAPIAILNDNGDLIIKDYDNQAAIELDFNKFMQVVLLIDPDSNVKFTVKGLEPIGGKNSGNYRIVVEKYFGSRARSSRSGKSHRRSVGSLGSSKKF